MAILRAGKVHFSHTWFQIAVCSRFVLRCVTKKIWKRKSQSKPHVPASVASREKKKEKKSQACFSRSPKIVSFHILHPLSLGAFSAKPASLFGTCLEILRYERLHQFSNTNVLSRFPYLLWLCVDSTESCRSTIIL